MTDLETYIDNVTNEICLLGMMYSDEYGTDYSNARDNMYNARSTMTVMFKQDIKPARCAGMIFSLHVHPVKF